METITYLSEPIVCETHNRNILDQANEDATGEYKEQIFVGKNKITFLTEEAAKKYRKITGCI